jgi:hypothetical protein
MMVLLLRMRASVLLYTLFMIEFQRLTMRHKPKALARLSTVF